LGTGGTGARELVGQRELRGRNQKARKQERALEGRRDEK